LKTTYRLLRERARGIPDLELQRSFLAIAAHQQLRAEWQRLGEAEDLDHQGDGVA
jgi:hypothetical protein